MRFLLFLAKLIVSFWLAVIFHELGHACVGALCGLPIEEINLGGDPLADESEDESVFHFPEGDEMGEEEAPAGITEWRERQRGREFGDWADEMALALEEIGEEIQSWSIKIGIQREMNDADWEEYFATDDADFPDRTKIIVELGPWLFPQGGYVLFDTELYQKTTTLETILILLAGAAGSIIGGLILLRSSSNLRPLAAWKMIGGVFWELLKVPVPFFSKKAKEKRWLPGPIDVIAAAIRDPETGGYPWLRFLGVISILLSISDILIPVGDCEELIKLGLAGVISAEDFNGFLETMEWVIAILFLYLLVFQLWGWAAGPAIKLNVEERRRYKALKPFSGLPTVTLILFFITGCLFLGPLGLIIVFVLIERALHRRALRKIMEER